MHDPVSIAAVAFVATIGALVGFRELVLALERRRRRRAQHHAQAVVRQRLDELAALPSPDELPRADDVSKATRRRMTARQHPVPRKRGSRRYGA